MGEIADYDRHMVSGMLDLAVKIAEAGTNGAGDGALHIFIADGNCEDEDIEFCMQQPNITADEFALCELAMQWQDEARFGAWFFAKHPSALPALVAAVPRDMPSDISVYRTDGDT